MKVLLLDIETSFKIAGIWGLYDQNLNMGQVFQDTYVLNWGAKWLGSKEILSDALHYHKTLYKKDPTNDKAILKSVWKLLDEADFVIAHNGARFDGPVLNGRFLAHGMVPPSPYKMIDTLKISRKNFKLSSNKLDDLGKYLKLGGKMDTGGFALWKEVCIDRNKKSFDKMVAYCKRDVELLEKVYLKLRTWDKGHPNLALESKTGACNVCGSSKVRANGTYYTATGKYQRYQCAECGYSMSGNKLKPTRKPLKGI